MSKKINEEDLKQIKYSLEAMVRVFAERIAPVYKTLNWTWGNNIVPNEDDIVETLKELINTLIECTSKDLPKSFEVSTGGLKVEYDYSDNECREVNISFVDDYTVYPVKIKD